MIMQKSLFLQMEAESFAIRHPPRTEIIITAVEPTFE